MFKRKLCEEFDIDKENRRPEDDGDLKEKKNKTIVLDETQNQSVLVLNIDAFSPLGAADRKSINITMDIGDCDC